MGKKEIKWLKNISNVTTVTKQGTAFKSSSSSLAIITSCNSTLWDSASFYPSLLHASLQNFFLSEERILVSSQYFVLQYWKYISKQLSLQQAYLRLCLQHSMLYMRISRMAKGFTISFFNFFSFFFSVLHVLLSSLHAFITSDLCKLSTWIQKHSVTKRYILSKCSSKQSQYFYLFIF